MKKPQQLKILTNWDDLPEEMKEEINDCEFVLMANENRRVTRKHRERKNV
jgi:hypothetical protein